MLRAVGTLCPFLDEVLFFEESSIRTSRARRTENKKIDPEIHLNDLTSILREWPVVSTVYNVDDLEIL